MKYLKSSIISELSIVTITYNDSVELNHTLNSTAELRKLGCTQIVINGGESVKNWIPSGIVLIEKKDKGIYDALNYGITQVRTSYFMLLHSGDVFALDISSLEEIILKMQDNRLNLALLDCELIYGKLKRRFRSSSWKPFMFRLGIQPAHPSIIYELEFVSGMSYRDDAPIIADFDYLERLFVSKPCFITSDEILVSMSGGGKTSSGLKSFIRVSYEFYKLKGILKASIFLFPRLIFKIFQLRFF